MGSSEHHNLLEQASSGDRRALTDLLEEHTPSVRQQLTGKIPTRWQSLLSIDDVLQQTYTDAFLHINGFVERADGSFCGWLCSIASHNLTSAVRMLETGKRGGRRRRGGGESLDALAVQLGVSRSTPSQHAARNEANHALKRDIEGLPETYRQVVQMHDLDDVPIEDVSQALDRSVGAVYMMRNRALQGLRDLLGGASKYFSKT